MGYILTPSGFTGPAWYSIDYIYRKMGLSEEEIGRRIMCKCDRVLECKSSLDECDRK